VRNTSIYIVHSSSVIVFSPGRGQCRLAPPARNEYGKVPSTGTAQTGRRPTSKRSTDEGSTAAHLGAPRAALLSTRNTQYRTLGGHSGQRCGSCPKIPVRCQSVDPRKQRRNAANGRRNCRRNRFSDGIHGAVVAATGCSDGRPASCVKDYATNYYRASA